MRKILRSPLTWTLAAIIIAAPLWLYAAKFHKQRAQRLTGIPCYDYKFQSRSPSSQATATGLMFERRISETAQRLITNQAFLQSIVRLQKPTILKPSTQSELETLPTPGASSDASSAPALDTSDIAGRTVNPNPQGIRAATSSGAELIGDRSTAERMLRESLLDLASLANPERNVRVYQLDRAQLAVDHCFVSSVAVQLFRNGSWVLSLRADQNPRQSNEQDEPYVYRPKLHLKRNEFNLRLRCYGLYGGTTAPRSLQAGRPILANLHPVVFWVERMEPRHLRIACHDPQIAQNFDKINRMEVEFFYR